MSRRPVRIAVLVSGNGTNLQALIDAAGRGEIPAGELAAVISSDSRAYALERAKGAGIAALGLDKKSMGNEAFERQLLDALREYDIELIVLAGFLHILSPAFFKEADRPILNIHPALLPAFGGKGYYGLKVHQAVLEAGVSVTGATVHYVNEIPDGGEIILRREVAVHAGDTPESLQQRVMEQAEWVILPQAAAMVCEKIAANRA